METVFGLITAIDIAVYSFGLEGSSLTKFVNICVYTTPKKSKIFFTSESFSEKLWTLFVEVIVYQDVQVMLGSIVVSVADRNGNRLSLHGDES